jgi:hypothetical protein
MSNSSALQAFIDGKQIKQTPPGVPEKGCRHGEISSAYFRLLSNYSALQAFIDGKQIIQTPPGVPEEGRHHNEILSTYFYFLTPTLVVEGLCQSHTSNFALPALATLTLF